MRRDVYFLTRVSTLAAPRLYALLARPRREELAAFCAWQAPERRALERECAFGTSMARRDPACASRGRPELSLLASMR